MWKQEELNDNIINSEKPQKEKEWKNFTFLKGLTEKIKNIFNNSEQKKGEEKSSEWEKNIFILSEKEWKFDWFQSVPIEAKKWGLIIFGTVIRAKEKKGMTYITVRYNDEKWKLQERSFPEGELIWMDERYKITKDYYKEKTDKIKYVRIPYKNTVVVGIINWKNEKWEYIIQIIGDENNSIKYYSKETLDEYNIPLTKTMNLIRIDKRQIPHIKDILKKCK